jgi:[amino group carrier protein]-6-phospho-L-2-aminoadipate/5-phospho-L-glutamate reductase
VTTTAAVIGGSGFIGGELVRLLLGHPEIELTTVTSARLAGRRVDTAHPNLRGRTRLTFTDPVALTGADVLFVAAPHTETMALMPRLLDRGKVLIDLSGDFRLADPGRYRQHYGVEHTAAHLLGSFVPGLPELYRERLLGADRISVPGCMANAAILATHPLAAAGLIEGEITVDARTGSSGSGAGGGQADTHAERSGAMRVFAPLGHRHQAEIEQATGHPCQMTATGVEAVRGVQVLCRARLRDGIGTREVRDAYRSAYAAEPFVRIVAQQRGMFRLPDPKILAGSNFCDVGPVTHAADRRVLAVGALDNLVKGGAGNAVQCLNIRLGWPEDLGLGFTGLHPI